MKKNNRDPRRDAVAEALRTSIMSGELKPGDRLREELLAEQFGVSRVPIREALSRLESEGFVTITPFRGAAVSDSSKQDVLELIQVRRGLEVLAAQLAADARGGSVRDRLTTVVRFGHQATREHRLGDSADLTIEFHQLVAEASGNATLQQMIDTMLQRISWGFSMAVDHGDDVSWADHSAIAAAIIHGSAASAGYLMGEHIAKDEALFLARLDEAGRTTTTD
ncbi:GntR family transcriptional regulator [Nocardia sp. NPDC058379]|uniref:GntR family transcriptional regulator n=1 Tax=unclassified Nocardia TaxID=2637762 RepID=UPI003659BA96